MKGLGAALIEGRKTVAFASKALTDVEVRYTDIERDFLAVVYGCEKFNIYLYGRTRHHQNQNRQRTLFQRPSLPRVPPSLSP